MDTVVVKLASTSFYVVAVVAVAIELLIMLLPTWYLQKLQQIHQLDTVLQGS